MLNVIETRKQVLFSLNYKNDLLNLSETLTGLQIPLEVVKRHKKGKERGQKKITK